MGQGDRDQRLVMLPADVSRELVSSAKVLLVDGHDAGAAVQAATQLALAVTNAYAMPANWCANVANNPIVKGV